MTTPSRLESRPRFDGRAALAVFRSHWTDADQIDALPSERDQNWLVYVHGVPRYVLKIANSADGVHGVDFQQQMIIRAADAGIPCPGVVPTDSGRTTVEADDHQVWLVDYLPGTALARLPDVDAPILHHLGSTLGVLAHACSGFDHPAAHRWLQWDVRNTAQVIGAYRDEVPDPAGRILLGEALEGYEQRVRPRMTDLPHAVIHNDANDHNVLVSGQQVSGLLDFGDAVYGPIVHDLAVACAYAMLDRADPQAVAEQICVGFAEERPLTVVERAVLSDLIRIRLATSVAISAHQAARNRHDPYLSISEQPAWRLLRHLMGRNQ